MLTNRTQTRHLTVGNEVMSVSTTKVPTELVGMTIADAARSLQPESLIAVVDNTGEIIMVVDVLLKSDNHYTLCEHDKLLIATDIR